MLVENEMGGVKRRCMYFIGRSMEWSVLLPIKMED
jgi:hypothetical protein